VQKIKWITVLVVWLVAGNLLAQAGQQAVETKGATLLDAQQEKRALQSLLKIAEKEIIPAVDAMPGDKFGFAPTDGNSKACVRLVKWLNTCPPPTTFWPQQPRGRNRRPMRATKSGLKL
jgi:hypothetical protein